MKTYNFSELRNEIQGALDAKVKLNQFAPDNLLTIFEGFIYMPIQPAVGDNYQIGGPAIPMVGAFGNITGKVYYFPLKILVPRIELG